MFLTSVICYQSIEAMNNGISDYKRSGSSLPPLHLLCTDCGELLDTARKADCGHRYHQKCIGNWLGKICNEPGCTRIIWGETIHPDISAEEEVKKYLTSNSPRKVMRSLCSTQALSEVICTICSQPCDANSVTYLGEEQSIPAHAACIINQSEQAQTNQNSSEASFASTSHLQQKNSAIYRYHASIMPFSSALALDESFAIQQTASTTEEGKKTGTEEVSLTGGEQSMCIICGAPIISSSFHKKIDNLPMHEWCLANQKANLAPSAKPVTNQAMPEDKLLTNDNPTKEITDGISEVSVSTPQDTMVCHSSPLQLSITPVTSHGRTYRKRELRDYQKVLEDQHGSLNRKHLSFSVNHLYPPAKSMSNIGIDGLRRLIQKYCPLPGFEFKPGQPFHYFLQQLRQQIQSMNPGEYLILLAFTDKKDRAQEPANLVVISRSFQEDEWDRGDVDPTKMGEREHANYCLLVVSSEMSDANARTGCLQVLSRDEVEQMVYIALLHLFAFWREHVVVLAPKANTILPPINVSPLLGEKDISSGEAIPFLFSIRNLMKTFAMVSGLSFYDFEGQVPVVLEPLKKYLEINTENKDKKIADLDIIINNQLGTGDMPKRKVLDSDDDVISKIKTLGFTSAGILKLELSTFNVDSAQYYIFFVQNKYYIYCLSDKEIPILMSDTDEYVITFFRFVLLGMQPIERLATYLMDS